MNPERTAPEVPPAAPPPVRPRDLPPPTLYRLCEEMIALREQSSRQHKLFEQTLAKTRETLQSGFHQFAADTGRAYQQLRQELHGDKRVSLALGNELLEVASDLSRIVAATPKADDAAAVAGWSEAVAVTARKAQAALARHGIVPYEAVVGSAYDPGLHERMGGRPEPGMPPGRIAAQLESGYASQQPEFVLRRPKVIVSE